MTFDFEKERMTAFSNEGTPIGLIRFPRIRAGLVNIEQFFLYPEFRDKGMEEYMMEALLTHLQQTHQKAALSCPFAQQYISTHPQWKELLPGKLHFTTH